MAANKDDCHRNLKKSELGGVIIGCTNDTMSESLSSQVFGLPTEHIAYVQNIKEGLPLFLFNYDDRTLHGIYEAASSDKLETESDALTGEKYAAWVHIRVRQKYQPLAEHQFKHIINDNYYNGKDFQFELDRTQARRLMSYFSLMQYSPKSYLELLEETNDKMKELKASKQDYDLKMARLDNKMVEAGEQINQLEFRCLKWEPASIPPSVTLAADESQVDSSRFSVNLDQSIFIVGGYDWQHYLSTVYSFSPSNDMLRSHRSMSLIRACASIAKIDREIYILGGYSGLMFYEEGGRNDFGIFSIVEMFDPHVGRWNFARSMLEKRATFGVVEFRGAIFAVGGCGDNNYLKSAERYDPRERSWSRIPDMQIRRGSHSLVVLNEKLYAIGGKNESTVLPSVEIYDPRLGTWMAGEPMNQGRKHFVAAVVDESIYVIGGVKPNNRASEVIERYKEDRGWEETNLRAVGQRCMFASAIVLGEE